MNVSKAKTEVKFTRRRERKWGTVKRIIKIIHTTIVSQIMITWTHGTMLADNHLDWVDPNLNRKRRTGCFDRIWRQNGRWSLCWFSVRHKILEITDINSSARKLLQLLFLNQHLPQKNHSHSPKESSINDIERTIFYVLFTDFFIN